MPIQTDYHVHTALCKHATGPMEACVERAIELGLREIGFADHNPLPRGLGAAERMSEDQLDYYVQRVIDLQFQYRGKIEIKLGLEMDYVDGLEDYLRAQAGRYPWDYIIGSVHYLDRDCRVGSWPSHYNGDASELHARYFRLLRQLAGSGLCDIIAHLDIPKRAGHRNAGVTGEAEQTLQHIARAGLCLEVNTSGYRHPELTTAEPYPAVAIIERAVALGIWLVVNSDAHAPEHVGARFPEMETILRRVGCRELARFDGRRRESYAL
jgi:histidinol-phosphatase (PHP family)